MMSVAEHEPLGQLLLRPPRYGINAAAVPLTPGITTYIRITDIDESGRFSPNPKVGVDHPSAANYRLSKGELVFARTGASVGKSYLYDSRDGELVYAGFLIAVAPDPKRLSPKYLSLFAQTKEYWDWIARTSVRSGQPGVNGREYAQLPVPLPDIAMQEAIARAITDVDDLNVTLERLIAKKKAIKQGMMQQLLSGRVRLPGFTEPWAEVSLLQLANGQRDLFNDGDWIESPYITSSGNRLLQTGNIGVGRLLNHGAKRYISDTSFVKLNCKEVVPGDILVCRLAEPAGRACIVSDIGEKRMLTSVDVAIFRPDPRKGDRRFLVAVFSTPEWFQMVSERSGGSTRTRIARSELGRITLRLPGVEEQTRIADRLTDADSEIAVLENRSTKTRAIKEGMMQQLLTGRTRLPVSETAS
jgi:type I restriction enzyme S subunit